MLILRADAAPGNVVYASQQVFVLVRGDNVIAIGQLKLTADRWHQLHLSQQILPLSKKLPERATHPYLPWTVSFSAPLKSSEENERNTLSYQSARFHGFLFKIS